MEGKYVSRWRNMEDRQILTNHGIIVTGVPTSAVLATARVPGRQNEGIVDHVLGLPESTGQDLDPAHHAGLAELPLGHQGDKKVDPGPEALAGKDLHPGHVLNQALNQDHHPPSRVLAQGRL